MTGGGGAPRPAITAERAAWRRGAALVAGVDEVGRGAWAGPLTVGVAVLPLPGPARAGRASTGRAVRASVRDSKALSERAREAMFDGLSTWCMSWSVGHAAAEECDALGMSGAQRLAATRAFAALGVVPDHVLIDGSWDFVGWPSSERIVRGDRACLSIAAASILAKVTRDREMRGAAESFPGFDFDRNKGYPSPAHVLALRGFGPTTLHRVSWAPLKSLLWQRGLQRA